MQRIIIVAGRNVRTKQLRKYFKSRAKDKSEANKLKRPQMHEFWSVPVLTRLNDAHPEKASLKRIQRLLAMVGGAADVRKQREAEESLDQDGMKRCSWAMCETQTSMSCGTCKPKRAGTQGASSGYLNQIGGTRLRLTR